MSDRLAIAFCITACLFLLAGGAVQIGRPVLEISPLKPLDPGAPPIQGSGFERDAVYYSTPAPAYRGNVHFYGSWLGSARSTGSVHTRWFAAVPRFALFFSGYLNQPGNSLAIEVVTADSGIVRLPIPPELVPSEAWWVREIALPEGRRPVKFRIVAIDGSTDEQGWLGFSDPFIIRAVDGLQIAKELVLIVLTAAASIVAFFAPGLMLRERYPKLSFIWIPAPGILAMALLGLIAWVGPQAVKPRWICRFGLALLILAATYRFVRVPLSRLTSSFERRVLLVLLAVAAIAVAKSVYSLGPSGELYAGRISRTLEVGARSDSRMSYHGVQLVAFRSNPHSGLAAMLYYPWDFSSRGPLASLAVSPIVLSSPIQVSTSMPDADWELFDPQGFTAFRIAMIVIACCALASVFGIASYLLPEDWAFLAFLVTMTAPFVIHEIYFTWPKLLAASFVVMAAYLVFRSRHFLAGLFLGLGYLSHPSALMMFPALVGISFLSRKPLRLRSWVPRIAAMCLGAAVWPLLWGYINRGHFAQGFFLSYFTMTAGTSWLHSRLDSLLNTLVPLNLFLFHRNSVETTSIYESSPPLIRFFFQYWNTLPFGVGLGLFFTYLVRAFAITLSKALVWLILVFVIPFAFFLAYWGMSSGGLTREGLHAWVLGLLISSIVIWKKFPPASDRFWRFCNWALLFRGLEIVLMLLLPTIASGPVVVQRQFQVSDVLALLIMVGGTSFLCVYVFRFAEKIRQGR